MPTEEEGEGSIETALGRVTFRVVREPGGSFTIPRGTLLTFPNGTAMGTIAQDVRLNGFSQTGVSLSKDTDQFTFEAQPGGGIEFKNLPAISAEMPRLAKSALDRLLEDEDLV